MTILYAAQPEAHRTVYLTTEKPDCDFPVISEADGRVVCDVRRELERARELYPPFPNLYAAKDQICLRARQLSARLTVSSGQMDAEVKRKLEQTAAMCLRALTENG